MAPTREAAADLCHLNDSVLADIGITRGEIDFIDPRDFGSRLRSPPSQSDTERLGMFTLSLGLPTPH